MRAHIYTIGMREGRLRWGARLHGTVKTVPYKQLGGKQLLGKAPVYGRFVGDAYMRPVRFTWKFVISGRLQRAAYMPPLRSSRYVVATAKSRAGRAPPLPCGVCLLPRRRTRKPIALLQFWR